MKKTLGSMGFVPPTLMERYFKQLNQAVETVLSGVCKRVDVDENVKVYACKNIIRIDIKVAQGGSK